MNQIVRNSKEEPRTANDGSSSFDQMNESSSYSNRFKLLPWLTGVICILVLLYGSSYLALLWLPPHKEVDMSSQLTADYSPWAFLVFQPVDPAIIEEIKQERELPEQVVMDGLFWPTPTKINTTLSNPEKQQPGSTPTATPMPASSLLVTSDNLQSSPTAIQPPYTSTPISTGITAQPEPTDTPGTIEILEPTKRPKPTRRPKPDKPQKPFKD